MSELGAAKPVDRSAATGAELSSPLGLIAGGGTLPFEFARVARTRGLEVLAIAHHGETNPELEQEVSSCVWIRVGQLGRMLRALKRGGVKQVAFAGGITRVRLFSGARPDLRGLRLIARVGSVRDDLILRGVAEEVEAEGIQVIAPDLLLERLVATPGLLTRRDLTADERADARLGWDVCRAIGSFDVGQTVIVTQGVVSAVEAVEGTDQAIVRAGELAGDGGTVVKTSKPQQDTRLDLPTIGEQTIRSMRSAGAKALVLEAGKTLILNPEDVVQAANAAGIAVRVFTSRDEI